MGIRPIDPNIESRLVGHLIVKASAGVLTELRKAPIEIDDDNRAVQELLLETAYGQVRLICLLARDSQEY